MMWVLSLEHCPARLAAWWHACSHFKGNHVHNTQHTFRTHHPVASQHNMYTQETSDNPWGRCLAGAV